MRMVQSSLTLHGYEHHVCLWPPASPPAASLLALHGFGTTGYRTFRYIAPRLAEAGLLTLAPDLLGFGASAAPEAGYSLALYARLTAALAREQGLDRPVLAGHSLGGKIAAATVALYPETFRGLVLINPGGFSRYARWLPPIAEARLTHWLFRQDWFLRFVLPRTPLGPVLGSAESLAQFFRLRHAHRALDLDHTGLRARLRATRLPALVVWGEHDPILPRSTLRRILRDLPHARVALIADAGHAPMKDQPDRTAEAIAAFVRDLTPDRNLASDPNAA
ncbi:MAG: alpha/beta hydrolase [Bacteroidetes bacterium]|nr:MAG: alpha/beta hydrolase [Bacteroidota bacterium]